jgi:four helix bundle protein
MPSATFEDLQILKTAEQLADSIWKQVVGWEAFARDTVGGQLARSVDSIGANIAESYGRFHFGEKLQFLYYARGSLFETRYWLNRARERNLTPAAEVAVYLTQLTSLAKQLNSFAGGLKDVRADERSKPRSLGEPDPTYLAADSDQAASALFSPEDLDWLAS